MKKQVPPLSNKDYQDLKESIKKDGLFFSITVNEKDEILDGHHRQKACNELGIEPKVVIKKFDNPIQEKRFVIESNLKRRHLQIHERARLATELQKLEEEEARERQEKAGEFGKLGGRPSNNDNNNKTNNEIGQEKPIPKNLGKGLEDLYKFNNTKDRNERKENESRQRSAKQFHLSDETLRQYQYVCSNGETELVDQMKNGWIKNQ